MSWLRNKIKRPIMLYLSASHTVELFPESNGLMFHGIDGLRHLA
jgi:hypothetical protein